MKKNYIITIGRQLGSGGKLLGEKLSEKLSIPCYDKELLHIASKESGLGKEFFEKADEQNNPSFFKSFWGFKAGYAGDITDNYLSNEKLFQIQSDVIKSLAEKGSCIFVGRCADYILRDHKRLLSIFVSAHMNDRIQSLSKNNSLIEQDAKALIEQTDKKRSEYYNYFSNKIWGMANSYDLCFNSSVIAMEKMIQFIELHIRHNYLESANNT